MAFQYTIISLDNGFIPDLITFALEPDLMEGGFIHIM